MASEIQGLVRDRNQQKILETIISAGSISRADLSKELGLTKATISSQVQGLLDLGLIQETGSLATSKGRHPIMLRFRAEKGQILSLDIGADQIHLMRANLLGQQCRYAQCAWNGRSESLLPLLSEIISGEQKDCNIVGICIAIHGTVHENQILFTPYYRLAHMPLSEKLEEQFHIPVFLENEANLSALGEHTFSFHVSSLINISVHSGIGLGIIMNGQLYTGANGYAGEFGHTIAEPGGLPCPCGNCGCIEQYASEAAILRNYRQLKQNDSATIDDLVRDYRKKDPAACSTVADFIKYMAIGLNNIVTIFNPQLIVINSLLTTYLPDVVTDIRRSLANPMCRGCTIVPSTLQDTATLLGGISVCSRNFLGIDQFNPPL